LFHDIFEIVRTYLPNGELVNLHDNYDNCICYISDDGLSGFAIEENGNLISVFNLSSTKGFLESISNYVLTQGATHLDAYASSKQNLKEIYEKTLGWTAASTMDYNMEYDHDDIAQNHGNPEVVFMVAPKEGKTEHKHFDKDSYDNAVTHQQSQIDTTAFVKQKKLSLRSNGSSQSYELSPKAKALRDAITDVIKENGNEIEFVSNE